MEEFKAARFEDAMPQVLQNDKAMYRIGQLLGNSMRRVNADTVNAILWARIDELDEETLDVLAYDLHVDWWKHAATLESKRQTLKNSIRVHSVMGTPNAVETAVSALLDCKTEVSEWYEYGGDPGFFRVAVWLARGSPWNEVIDTIYRTKRCSAWLEGLTVKMDAAPAVANAAAAYVGEYRRYTVQVAVPETVGWPRVRLDAGAVSPMAGLRERFTVPVRVPGTVGWPTVAVQGRTGPPAMGVRERVTVAVQTPEGKPPQVRLEGRAGGAAGQVRQIIRTEVNLHGLEL